MHLLTLHRFGNRYNFATARLQDANGQLAALKYKNGGDVVQGHLRRFSVD